MKRKKVFKKSTKIRSLLLLILAIGVFFISESFCYEQEITLGDKECNVNQTKKIIAIVYDDSGSMSMNGNTNYTYASYAMQNLIGLANKNDEIYDVKMFKSGRQPDIEKQDLSKRQDTINRIKDWGAPIDSCTYFTAVEKAVNKLKEIKKKNGDSQDYEYWLILLTDGRFEKIGQCNPNTGYTNLTDEYKKVLTDYKNYMSDVKNEGVMLGIGSLVPEGVKNDWGNIFGKENVFSSNGENDIVKAMAGISNSIYGISGEGSKVNISQSKNDKKTITFDLEYPIQKMIVFEQNQNVKIKSIKIGKTSYKVDESYTTSKNLSENVKSLINHVNFNGKIISGGKVTIEFENDIDISDEKLKILLQYGVTTSIEIVSKEKKAYKSGDKIEIRSCIISLEDCKKKIEFDGNVDANIYIYDQNVKMEYNSNDKCYHGIITMGGEDAHAYVKMESPGYFRTKSDTIDLEKILEFQGKQTTDKVEIIVPYTDSEDYVKAGTFNYKITGNAHFEDKNVTLNFEGIPNGVTIEIDGKEVKNGKIDVTLTEGQEIEAEVKRNNQYTEEENKDVNITPKSSEVDLNLDDKNVTVTLVPSNRNLVMEIEELTEDDLTVTNFDGKEIISIIITADGTLLTKSELEKGELTFEDYKGIEFDYEVVEDKDGNASIKVTLDKDELSMFIDPGMVEMNPEFKTEFNEDVQEDYSFELKDDWKKYLPLLWLLLLIILIIGYLPGVKNRLHEKDFYIKSKHMNQNKEDNQIVINKMSRILPYVSEKGTCAGLQLKATKSPTSVDVTLPAGVDMDDMSLDKDDIRLNKDKKTFRLPIDGDFVIKEKGKVIDTFVYSNGIDE